MKLHGDAERSAGGGARGGPPRRAWGHQRVPPFTESEAPEGEREEGRPDERGGSSGCPRSRRAKRRRGSARRAAPTSVGAPAGAPVHGERSAGGGARGGPPRRAWGHQRVPPFTESEAP